MKGVQDTHQYDDIMGLPRPRSTRHAPMPLANRAAQFMPFAALTGYEAAVREEARLTDRKIPLDDDALTQLNARLEVIDGLLPEAPDVTVTYFVPDPRKQGGAYRSLSGRVRRIDPVAGRLIMRGGAAIPLGDIWRIESELFPE